MSSSIRHIGKYELHERLDHNSVTEVWRAYDTTYRRAVNLTLLNTNNRSDPESAVHFAQEAESIAGLHHANIAQLYDARILPTNNGQSSLAYLATDFVEGQTLEEYIRSIPRSGKLPTDIVRIFALLGMAIDYAHQNGIVHGNIRPANILLARSPANQGVEPIVINFGLLRLLETVTGNLARQSVEMIRYISPEQARGGAGTDRSDIYSLGVVLYEICTGVLPFQGNRPVALLMQHASAVPTSPSLINPNISPALTKVIMRCLAKEPELRYTSALSLALALARALNTPLPTRVSPLITYQIERDAQIELPTDKIGMGYASTNGQIIDPHTAKPSSTQRGKGRPKRNMTLVVMSLLLLITLGVSTVFAYLLLRAQNGPAPLGHAFYISSQPLTATDGNQGINDDLQVDLAGIPNPPAGKSYYIWLLADKAKGNVPPKLLDKLAVNNGKVHYLYTGGSKGNNLLATTSRLLITVGEENVTPTALPKDNNALLYYAEIPQSASPNDKLHFSMLDHFRHLFVDSPELQVRGMNGGLALWLFQSTQKVFALTSSVKEAWQVHDFNSVRSQVGNLLAYLDGPEMARNELPRDTRTTLDPHNIQVPLLGMQPTNAAPPGFAYNTGTPPGLIYLVSLHLSGAFLSADATPDQRALAAKISTAVDDMERSLDQVHDDALLLSRMDDDQLNQASFILPLLNDMAIVAQFAYAGRISQITGQSQGGVVWIYSNLQHLVDFAIKPYGA